MVSEACDHTSDFYSKFAVEEQPQVVEALKNSFEVCQNRFQESLLDAGDAVHSYFANKRDDENCFYVVISSSKNQRHRHQQWQQQQKQQ